MSGNKSEWVYDELLCFLGSAFFQVPVSGFIEGNCLIFDPSVEASAEYKQIHGQYKKVIEALLDAFTKDVKLSYDDIIKALNELNSKKDIREVFQGLFEQVLAMDDFEIFVNLMTQKNIELQQQALILIMKTQGGLPDSLTEGATAPPPQAGHVQAAESEDEIMRRVLEQSKREYEEEQGKLKKTEKKDKKQIDAMIAISKQEVTSLEQQKQTEKEKMSQAMANLKLTEAPPLPGAGVKAPAAQKPVVVVNKPVQPVITTPGVSQVGASGVSVSQTKLGPGLQPATKLPGISNSQAADNWLKSAQAETTTDSHAEAVQKAAAAMAGMSADEIKKRQEYLRQQRDKLLAMKKKEREKQLLTAEQSNPGRPISAQVARRSMKGESSKETQSKVSPEEQKKIEMRRTIANKLKAELMGNN